MLKKNIVTLVMLIVTSLLLSGCLLLPVPVGDGDGGGHRGGGRGDGGRGHWGGGDRHRD